MVRGAGGGDDVVLAARPLEETGHDRFADGQLVAPVQRQQGLVRHVGPRPVAQPVGIDRLSGQPGDLVDTERPRLATRDGTFVRHVGVEQPSGTARWELASPKGTVDPRQAAVALVEIDRGRRGVHREQPIGEIRSLVANQLHPPPGELGCAGQFAEVLQNRARAARAGGPPLPARRHRRGRRRGGCARRGRGLRLRPRASSSSSSVQTCPRRPRPRRGAIHATASEGVPVCSPVRAA